MNIKHISTGLSLAVIIGLFCTAHAAERSFQTTSVGKWVGPDLFVKQSSDYTQLQLNDVAISTDYSYRAGSPIPIYKAEVNARGKKKQTLAQKITIPAHISQPLIVFLPNEKDKDLHFIVLEFATKSYPGGTLRFVNLCADDIAVSLGKKPTKLAPNEAKILKNQGDDPGRVSLNISLILKDKAAKKVNDVGTMLISKPTKRMTIFVTAMANKRGKTLLSLRTLEDFIPNN